MSNQIFNYNGSDITMNKENGKIYVNATEMAKPFNKRTSDWLSTKQANELISSLSIVTGIPVTVLVSVNQGGTGQGTWMQEKGYLCKSGERYNQPTQSAMDAGIFEVSYNTVVRSDKSIQTITTKVTGKGQIYFVNKFLGEKELA